MNRNDSRLLRHLATAVAAKLVGLSVLWWAFVHDRAVDADSEQTAAHVSVPTSPAAARQPITTTTGQELPR
jgi:hypothetical protein